MVFVILFPSQRYSILNYLSALNVNIDNIIHIFMNGENIVIILLILVLII